MSRRSLLIVGSGPGIGVATARLFASKGFTHVGLISRDASRLASDADAVRQAASTVDVRTFPADAGDVRALRSALDRFREEMGAPTVILYNAARIAPTKIGREGPDVLVQDYRLMVVGLYVVVSWALPYLEERIESEAQSGSESASEPRCCPTVLLSGGSVHEDPLPEVFSLSMQKAAQHNLIKSLAKEYGPKGIHFGMVNIGGVVSDDDPVINAKNISHTLWDLAQEERKDWRLSVDIGVKRDS